MWEGLQTYLYLILNHFHQMWASVCAGEGTDWQCHTTDDCSLFVSVFSTSGPVTQPAPVLAVSPPSQLTITDRAHKLPFFFGISAYLLQRLPDMHYTVSRTNQT